jgi:hypothetical protein
MADPRPGMTARPGLVFLNVRLGAPPDMTALAIKLVLAEGRGRGGGAVMPWSR